LNPETVNLELGKKYKITVDTPVFKKGEVFMFIKAAETAKAIGIIRGIKLTRKRRQWYEKHSHKHRYTFRGEMAFPPQITFWLPKSQISVKNNVITLPKWLAEKVGLPLLKA